MRRNELILWPHRSPGLTSVYFSCRTIWREEFSREILKYLTITIRTYFDLVGHLEKGFCTPSILLLFFNFYIALYIYKRDTMLTQLAITCMVSISVHVVKYCLILLPLWLMQVPIQVRTICQVHARWSSTLDVGWVGKGMSPWTRTRDEMSNIDLNLKRIF